MTAEMDDATIRQIEIELEKAERGMAMPYDAERVRKCPAAEPSVWCWLIPNPPPPHASPRARWGRETSNCGASATS